MTKMEVKKVEITIKNDDSITNELSIATEGSLTPVELLGVLYMALQSVYKNMIAEE